MIFRIHCPDFMSYVYRLHSILCVLLLSEGTNLHVASFNSCSDSYVFFRCSHIYEAHFSCKFFPSVCLLGYMSGLLCQSTLFDCHGLLLLVVLGLFGHGAAGFDFCDPDTWNFS